MNKRTITVKGRGSASAPPDWIKITMSLEAKNMDYEKTVNLAAKQLDQLRKSLEEHGFSKKDIKTTDFNVDTSYESVKDITGNYNRVFRGYLCSQNLYIGFEVDSRRLGNILRSLSRCESKPEFSIKYQLKDEKNLKEKLLKNAIADAIGKAKVIALAANVDLGEIMHIDYDWTEIRFVREDFQLSDASYNYSAASIDIEPEDIEASDNVSIIWEIE